jgi:hypothetical protein
LTIVHPHFECKKHIDCPHLWPSWGCVACLWTKLSLIGISEGDWWHLWNIYKIISTFASKKATRAHLQFEEHEKTHIQDCIYICKQQGYKNTFSIWKTWAKYIYKIIFTFASKKATRTHLQFGKHGQITLDMFYKANGTWVN